MNGSLETQNTLYKQKPDPFGNRRNVMHIQNRKTLLRVTALLLSVLSLLVLLSGCEESELRKKLYNEYVTSGMRSDWAEDKAKFVAKWESSGFDRKQLEEEWERNNPQAKYDPPEEESPEEDDEDDDTTSPPPSKPQLTFKPKLKPSQENEPFAQVAQWLSYLEGWWENLFFDEIPIQTDFATCLKEAEAAGTVTLSVELEPLALVVTDSGGEVRRFSIVGMDRIQCVGPTGTTEHKRYYLEPDLEEQLELIKGWWYASNGTGMNLDKSLEDEEKRAAYFLDPETGGVKQHTPLADVLYLFRRDMHGKEFLYTYDGYKLQEWTRSKE